MVRMGETLFLRFYAANLSRKRRNDPPSACLDAVLQLSAVGGLVSTTLYIVAGLLLSRSLLDHMYAVDRVYLAVSGVCGGMVGFLLSHPFRAYKQKPEAARPYSSTTAIRVLNVLYVAIPIAWAWAIGLALRILDSRA